MPKSSTNWNQTEKKQSPVIKDEAVRKHAMPYTPGYNPTNTLQGMLMAK